MSPGACLSHLPSETCTTFLFFSEASSCSLLSAHHTTSQSFHPFLLQGLTPYHAATFLVLLAEGTSLSNIWRTGMLKGSIKAVGTSFVVFWSLNTFQEGQPKTFLVAAGGALRRIWFAEFLAVSRHLTRTWRGLPVREGAGFKCQVCRGQLGGCALERRG